MRPTANWRGHDNRRDRTGSALDAFVLVTGSVLDGVGTLWLHARSIGPNHRRVGSRGRGGVYRFRLWSVHGCIVAGTARVPALSAARLRLTRAHRQPLGCLLAA